MVCVKILKNTYTVLYNKRTVSLDGKKKDFEMKGSQMSFSITS